MPDWIRHPPSRELLACGNMAPDQVRGDEMSRRMETHMKIGIIGLGRMGGNIARRLMRAGHETVVYDRAPETVKELAAGGAIGGKSLDDRKAAPDRPAL